MMTSIIIIIIQYLYSAIMSYADTEARGAGLRVSKEVGFEMAFKS